MSRCLLCGQFRTKAHSCNFISSINRNKGVRSYQEIVNYFLSLDRSRGVSWRKLAKIYKLDHKNIKDRVKTYNAGLAELVDARDLKSLT